MTPATDALAMPATDPGLPTGAGRAWCRSIVASRPTRVGMLIVACTLMGLTDLACTLAYVGGVGMFEQNPLARYIIERGGAPWLIVFKLCTMLVMGGCVYLSRRHRMGEQCAWLSCLMLTTLTLHWVRFNEEIVQPDSVEALMNLAATPEAYEYPNWVRFND